MEDLRQTVDYSTFSRFDLTRPGAGESVEVPPSFVKKLGDSGVIRTQNGLPFYDPNWSAMNPYRARGLWIRHGELHKMFFYDSVVNGVFSLMMIEVLRANWFIERRRDETPAETRKRELLEHVFGVGDNYGVMGGGLRRLVFHLFWAQLYGFSLVEIMWDWIEFKGGRYIVPVDARYRHPATINKWIYRGDDLIGCTQLVQSNDPVDATFLFSDSHHLDDVPNTEYKEVYIPIEKCLLRSSKGVDGNPEGISDFRTAFIWVKMKLEHITRREMALDQLYGGVQKVTELGDERGPYRTISQKDREAVRRMLDAFANGTSNRLVVPFGLEITVDFPTYKMPDDSDLLRYFDNQIMLGSTSSLLGLDAQRAASRGLSDSLAMVAYHAIEGGADDIAEVINGVPGRPWTGLVQKIDQYNFGTGEKAGRPARVKHFGISYQDIQKLTDSLSKASQMLLYAPDEHDEHDFRKSARINPSDFESIKKAREKISERNGQLQSQGGQISPNQPRSDVKDGNGDAKAEKKPKRS